MNKKSKGFTLVELLVVIGILGILMGALFPAITTAMLSANTRAMSINGKKLFDGIVGGNIEREAQGLQSLWPKDSTQKSDDDDDIAGKTFSDSPDYFTTLFEMDRYGKPEHKPYIDKDLLKTLSGCGVPPHSSGSKLNGRNVAWCVASGVTDEMEDIIPVLVTRNANVQKLPTKTQDLSQDKNEVDMGKANGGESDSPFGNKAFVCVSKGGAAQVVKAKYSKIYLIYNRQSIVVPESVTLKYLKTNASN